MTTTPDVAAAARELGLVLNERMIELENKVHTAIVALSDLEIEHKATLRRVEMLERRLARLEAAAEKTSEAQAGS